MNGTPLQPESKQPRVLVVDDSEFIRSYHTAILEDAQFEVTAAIDGGQGLEALLTRQYDVILTDLNMGHMDGLEFIRRLRSSPGYEETPVIILTTANRTTDKVQGLQAGANLYLVKPCEPATMVENIRMLLGLTN